MNTPIRRRSTPAKRFVKAVFARLGKGGPRPTRKAPKGWRRVLHCADWTLWWAKWAACYLATSVPFCIVATHFLRTTTVNS